MTDKSDLQHVKVTNRVVGLAAIVLLFVAAPSKAVWLDFAETANEKRNAISHAVYEIVINPALNLLDDGLSPGIDSRTFQERAEQLLGRTNRKLDKAADKAVREELKAIANMIGLRKARSFGSRLQAKIVNRATGFVKSKVLDATAMDRLVSGEREGGRLAGGHERGHGSIDMRIALAVDDDEREWYESNARVLGKTPLPAARFPRTRQASDPVPGTLVDAWDVDAGWSERSPQAGVSAADGDPWGQDPKGEWDSPPAAPAAAKVDVWSADAGESTHGRPGEASVATADPWGQDTGQGWTGASTAPVVGNVGTDPIDAEWQNEYAVALNHFLGLDDNDSSYEAALSTVVRLEHEAVERERLAEQQRLEAQERERQARIDAEKRERQIARMEAELESARAERRRRATEQGIIRGVQNAVSALQPTLDFQHQLVQRDREARLRRDLARLREQARAEQTRAAVERQQQQAAEQQRRQAEKQARLKRELQRRLRECAGITVGSGFGDECPIVQVGRSYVLDPACEQRRQQEKEKAVQESKRKVQACKQRAWDAYNRSGGGTLLGVGRLE